MAYQQKEFIWKSVKKIQEKEMNDTFQKLCHFDVNTDTYGTDSHVNLSKIIVVIAAPKASKTQDWQQIQWNSTKNGWGLTHMKSYNSAYNVNDSQWYWWNEH